MNQWIILGNIINNGKATIFTTEFIDSVRKCKTSKELTEKLYQAEEAVSIIQDMRDILMLKEMASTAKEMLVKQNH